MIVQGAGSVSLTALQTITNTIRPTGRTPRLLSDVVKNGSVESRLYINAKNAVSDLALGVVLKQSFRAGRVHQILSNQMRFVSFAQNNFGMNVTAAVRLNLTGMNTSNLKFYKYDAATHKAIALNNVTYTINSQGFLFITTSQGGHIVISDGALKR